MIQLANLKEKEGNPISKSYEYIHYKKKTKENENLNIYIILTSRMKQEIKEENIQFFSDATYRCIPPTLRKFRLYVISAFNIILKLRRIVCFSLIPNETEKTYSELFRILK